MQRLLGQRFPLGVHHRFEIVQQHHHGLPHREGLEQGQHHLRRAVLRVLVHPLEPLRFLCRQQPQQVRNQGRVVHLVHAVAAEVDDPAHRDRRRLTLHVRDPAGLQALEQSAHHGGLADPAAPGHGHQPDARVGQIPGQQARLDLPVLEPGRSRCRRRVDELRRPHRMRLGRDLLTLDPAADTGARLGQVAQRPLHQLPECVRIRERPCGQPAILHSPAERVLAASELAIDQRRQRDAHIGSVSVQQEHQPVQARLGRGGELQFRIGHLGFVPHGGAVPGAEHPHIHIAAAHPLSAHLRGSLTGRGKVGHIGDHVSRSRDRALDSRHVRPARREGQQLGGVRDEHPPPGTVAGTSGASQPHPPYG